jgi:DNA-binding NtrC family response regulator
LLRVLQERVFSRVGESRERPFRGKLIAATHHDLAPRMRDGRFRHDFFYRMCSDVIRTPNLATILESQPSDLAVFVRFLAERAAGSATTAVDRLVTRTLEWIETELDARTPGSRYPWPGNIRELEQCVRGILIRGSYHPPVLNSENAATANIEHQAFASMHARSRTAEQVQSAFVTHVYGTLTTYAATAASVNLDRRTVKRIVDAAESRE